MRGLDIQVRPLSGAERDALQQGLDMAARLLDLPRPLSASDVQMLYDIIRDAHRDADEAIIALGLAFGQLIADAADFEWLRVQDEYGEETALARKGFAAYCHPISMMQKRIEHGQQENLSELRDTTIRMIQDRVENGIWGKR